MAALEGGAQFSFGENVKKGADLFEPVAWSLRFFGNGLDNGYVGFDLVVPRLGA